MLLYLRAGQIPPDRSWDIVRWCHAHGADEFSWREMGIAGHPDPIVERANAALAPFRLPDQPRPTSVVYSDQGDRTPVQLWRLSEASIEQAIALLPDGLFTEPSYSDDGWIEDPTFYRAGDILLGVVSHEHEAFLQVSPVEAEELKRLGFSLYPNAMYG